MSMETGPSFYLTCEKSKKNAKKNKRKKTERGREKAERTERFVYVHESWILATKITGMFMKVLYEMAGYILQHDV